MAKRNKALNAVRAQGVVPKHVADVMKNMGATGSMDVIEGMPADVSVDRVGETPQIDTDSSTDVSTEEQAVERVVVEKVVDEPVKEKSIRDNSIKKSKGNLTVNRVVSMLEEKIYTDKKMAIGLRISEGASEELNDLVKVISFKSDLLINRNDLVRSIIERWLLDNGDDVKEMFLKK